MCSRYTTGPSAAYEYECAANKFRRHITTTNVSPSGGWPFKTSFSLSGKFPGGQKPKSARVGYVSGRARLQEPALSVVEGCRKARNLDTPERMSVREQYAAHSHFGTCPLIFLLFLLPSIFHKFMV